MTRTAAKRKSEDVTNGHIVIGRIVQSDRGFECFGPDGKYWFCDPTLAGARKAVFERPCSHAEVQEA